MAAVGRQVNDTPPPGQIVLFRLGMHISPHQSMPQAQSEYRCRKMQGTTSARIKKSITCGRITISTPMRGSAIAQMMPRYELQTCFFLSLGHYIRASWKKCRRRRRLDDVTRCEFIGRRAQAKAAACWPRETRPGGDAADRYARSCAARPRRRYWPSAECNDGAALSPIYADDAEISAFRRRFHARVLDADGARMAIGA